jgi:hypothetical protein
MQAFFHRIVTWKSGDQILKKTSAHTSTLVSMNPNRQNPNELPAAT